MADHGEVRDAVTGTVPTWDEVVEQHSDRVFRLAYRLTGNRPDAEDLTQEVFVRVFRSLSTYTPGTFEGWLHRITTNLFLDQARRKQRIRFDALSDERADRLTSASAPPDAAYADRTFDDDIERALASLPPEFRAAVVLCDVEGLSYQEIADIMDAKLGTVRSRIHRGRAMLREALAHRAPAPGRQRYAGPATAVGRGRADVIGHLGARVSALLDGQLSADGGGASLGARALLPLLPRRGRARGLGQDPAGRPLLRRHARVRAAQGLAHRRAAGTAARRRLAGHVATTPLGEPGRHRRGRRGGRGARSPRPGRRPGQRAVRSTGAPRPASPVPRS